MRILLTFTAFLLACVTMAQNPTITTSQTSYKYGENVIIQFKGVVDGDRILFYQNLSMFPMKEFVSPSEADGTYLVESLFEPGTYKAQIVNDMNEIQAETSFVVTHAALPNGSKKIVLLSDPHVMSPALVEDPNSSAYINAMAGNRKLQAYSAELFDAVIDSIKILHPDLVIIPGDMTKDGELLSHLYVEYRLNELKELGIRTLVIPGNHDMECGMGRIYTENGAVPAENVTIEEFRAIYKNFGWGEGSDFDDYSLTYACEPIPNLRFIGIDDCKTFSRGWTADGQAEYGCIPQPTLDWVLQQVDDAVAHDKVPVVAIHHQMLTHFNGQDEFVSASLDQGDSIARVFLDHGVRVVMTGHMHMPDISVIWNENRTDSLVEISSGSTASYPCQYRILTLDDNLFTMNVETRFLTSTVSLEDVETVAREQISTSLGSSIKKLVRSYLPKLRKVVDSYSSLDPALAIVLQDIPMNVDQLSAIVLQAFGPVMEKAVFTHCEGNENLKMAEDEIVAEFNEACKMACDLVFDNQDDDTKAFMLTLLQAQMQSRGVETILRSMLSDKAYLGLPDQSQDNDLYYTIQLRHDPNAIHPATTVLSNNEEIYNLTGQKMLSGKTNLKGVYLIRKDGELKKYLLK